MFDYIPSLSASQDAPPSLSNGIRLTPQFLVSTMELAQYELNQGQAEDHPGFDSFCEQLAILHDHQINILEYIDEVAFLPADLALTGSTNLVDVLLRVVDPVMGVLNPDDVQFAAAEHPSAGHPPITGGGITFTPPDFIANLAVTDAAVAGAADGDVTPVEQMLCLLYEQQISIFDFLGDLMHAPPLYLMEQEVAAQRAEPNNSRLTHDEAVTFVNTLEAVDMSTIDASDKCPHCWVNWDEETETNNSPIRLPCANGQHIIEFDCLIEILTAVGPLCPLCRVSIVTPSA